MSRQHMSRRHPPLATPLTSFAENMARTVRADPGERVRRLKLIAGAMAAVVLIGWTAGVVGQTTSEPTPPPLPPAVQGDAAQNNAAPAAPTSAPAPVPQPDNAQPAPQQADTQQQPPQQAAAQPANNSTNNAGGTFPALPLGHDGVREVQSQLIALGFEPGPADGEAGPATVAAAQQYNENRGGSGPVPIDGALLTRLQQDTGPRLTPEQVAARSQPRYQAQAPAANPLVGVMQQFESNLRGLFNGGY